MEEKFFSLNWSRYLLSCCLSVLKASALNVDSFIPLSEGSDPLKVPLSTTIGLACLGVGKTNAFLAWNLVSFFLCLRLSSKFSWSLVGFTPPGRLLIRWFTCEISQTYIVNISNKFEVKSNWSKAALPASRPPDWIFFSFTSLCVLDVIVFISKVVPICLETRLCHNLFLRVPQSENLLVFLVVQAFILVVKRRKRLLDGWLRRNLHRGFGELRICCETQRGDPRSIHQVELVFPEILA